MQSQASGWLICSDCNEAVEVHVSVDADGRHGGIADLDPIELGGCQYASRGGVWTSDVLRDWANGRKE